MPNVFISIIINICRFPFDWMNPIGYSVPMVLQYILLTYEISLVAFLNSFGLGTFLFTICIVKDMKSCLNTISEDWKKSKKFKSNIELNKRLRVNEARLKLSKELCNFVEFHGIMKKFG